MLDWIEFHSHVLLSGQSQSICVFQGSVCVASALATHPEINAFMARTVSVTTGSVRT